MPNGFLVYKHIYESPLIELIFLRKGSIKAKFSPRALVFFSISIRVSKKTVSNEAELFKLNASHLSSLLSSQNREDETWSRAALVKWQVFSAGCEWLSKLQWYKKAISWEARQPGFLPPLFQKNVVLRLTRNSNSQCGQHFLNQRLAIRLSRQKGIYRFQKAC